ncbi:MAG: glycosyltransferase family 4 protein [Actinomycetota bacterium]|nr:glycosyltransferase family 4 protein [Actinomycetota bacterium]
MRVGLVCPYSLDVPGGVQNHVKDLAEALIGLGNEVSVLAPSDRPDVAPYVVSAGKAVPVPYNGSVARLSFGPVVAGRVRRWLRDGAFDVVHLHEPATPSIALLALWAAEGPVVATFHTSQLRSRAMSASASILRPSLEKITARIAVSEYARDTLVQHIGGEPVVIPNGVYVDRYVEATSRAEWRGDAGTLAFVGRIDEPRKGLSLLLDAFETIARERAGVRLLVVGGGDLERARASVPAGIRDAVTFLGRASDDEKASALRSADVYVAPNTGGESFGIVLVEAMASGATVLASDIPAFRRVLRDGEYGALFESGNASDLAVQAQALLNDEARRRALNQEASTGVRRYDWSLLAGQIFEVYETVTGAAKDRRR